MHLDHKLPWNTLSTHLRLHKNDKSYTPPRSDIFWVSSSTTNPSHRESQSSTIKKAQDHFIRVFVRTLRSFATTKVQKHEEIAKAEVDEGKLWSEELTQYAERRFDLLPHETNSAAHNPLSDDMRRLEHWIDAAGPQDPESSRTYTTSNADLGDAVKFLITLAATASTDEEKRFGREAFSALLKLNRKVPLKSLDHLSWGHGFGVSLLAVFTLQIYMTINLYAAITEAAFSTRSDGKRRQALGLLQVESLVNVLGSDALADYDYPAQNILHRSYFHSLGVTEDYIRHQHLSRRGLFFSTENIDSGVTDPTANGTDEATRLRLKEYLKTCFAVLYIYDILMRGWYGDEEADGFWTNEMGFVFEKWAGGPERNYS